MDQPDEMDVVFRALADPSRRLLLDLLHQRDGQTLHELHAHVPMTRAGCMKHLRVLEEAGLVASRKVGRERFHYLNPVPIRLIQGRWVSKYAEPWAHALVGLKFALEDSRMDSAKQKPSQVYEVFIRTTPERLWRALTDGELSRQYYFGWRVESDWEGGSPYCYRSAEGAASIAGEVLEADPPRRLVTTFQPRWDETVAAQAPSTVTFEIARMGDVCKLTLVHEGFDPASFEGFRSGWSRILSGLKTLLETGEPLVVGAGE